MENAPKDKKGLHPMAWVGIGCGGLLLIAIVGISLAVGMCKKKVETLAAGMSDPATAVATVAETAIRLNPELELVQSDRDAGTITFREKKTGKEVTVSYEDVAEGNLTVETEEGTTTVEAQGGGIRTETPDGVVTIGGASAEHLPKWFTVPADVTNWQSIMHQERGGKVSGMVRGEAAGEPAPVIDAFAKSLEAAGFVRKSRTETEGMVAVNYEKAGTPRQAVNVSAFPQNGKKVVQITYSEH